MIDELASIEAPELASDRSGSKGSRRPRVLVLTPFYPSIKDPSQGSFIAEPLAHIGELADCETIVVQPFYRRNAGPVPDPKVELHKYASFPTNLGLAAAGELLGASLISTVTRRHRRAPFDLIHAHAALPCGLAAARLSKRLSIPFVISVHGLDAFFEKQGGVVGMWCKRVATTVYCSASEVICISHKVREQVSREIERNVTVIYNGVDTGLFSPGVESDLPKIVLSVGNLIPIKGHALLLRAFAQISAAARDWTLEIIGDGPERGNLGALARSLGISNRVKFHGRQSRSKVADAMERCAIFALPSAYEGLGCVYLEAMSCAKPVIGCYGQGIDEIIEHGETGMLVPPNDELYLRDVMLALVQNEELRKKIGTVARKAILGNYTLSHQARKLAEVYRWTAA